MKFDQLLQFLNNLAKAEFFTQNPEVRQIAIIGNRISADSKISGLEVPGDEQAAVGSGQGILPRPLEDQQPLKLKRL